MKVIGILLTGIFVSDAPAQIVGFNFNNSPFVEPSELASGIAVTDFHISAGSVQTNITTGTYFTDEPYVQGSSGWAQITQSAAKNFFVTITANSGFEFSISNIAFEGYASGAGPSAVGITVNSTSVFSDNMPDSSLVSVSESVTLSGLTIATIYIQGWDNGSRTTSGGGDFRIDNFEISGSVSAVPEPAAFAFLASVTMLGFALVRRNGGGLQLKGTIPALISRGCQ